MDKKRVLKTNLILLLVLSAILTAQRFLTSDIQIAMNVLIATGSACAVATFVYYFNTPFFLKGLVMSISPFYAALALSIILGGIPHMFLIYMGAFVLAALYFNTRLLTVSGIIINLSIIIAYLLTPVGLLGAEASTSDLIVKLGMIDSTGFLVLFLLTKWGNEALNKATESQRKSDGLLGELNERVEQLKKTTVELDTLIKKSKEMFDVSVLTSSEITETTSQIAEGASHEAQIANEIQHSMETIEPKIAITEETTNQISSVSTEMMEDVSESKVEVKDLNDIMGKIGENDTEQRDSMKGMLDNIKMVAESLKGISEISEQTNLLALNAAIEAARAGEAGKGFAVVADEIRGLADKSGEIVSNINIRINDMVASADLFIEKSEELSSTIYKVIEKMKKVEINFADISSSIDNMKNLIKEISKAADVMNNNSTQVKEAVKEIASVSEEVSSHAEEVAASSEEQSASTQEIVSTSEELSDMAQSLSDKVDQFKL